MNSAVSVVRSGVCVLAGLLASTAGAVQPPAGRGSATATASATVSVAAADQSERVVVAAELLLKQLSAEQRQAALFRFNDDEQRVRWSNLPSGIFARRGLRMGDLNAQQRQAVLDVVRATLSPAGYQAVLDNTAADEQLKSGGGGGRVRFGSDEFYFSLLGQPSREEAWMWQFGGSPSGCERDRDWSPDNSGADSDGRSADALSGRRSSGISDVGGDCGGSGICAVTDGRAA